MLTGCVQVMPLLLLGEGSSHVPSLGFQVLAAALGLDPHCKDAGGPESPQQVALLEQVIGWHSVVGGLWIAGKPQLYTCRSVH
jgi:hypothetical protein